MNPLPTIRRLLIATAVIAPGACLEIERVPARPSDGGSDAIADAASDSAFDANDCTLTCIDKTPEAAQQFITMSLCISDGRTGACANECSSDAGDAPPSQCPVPGVLSPVPPCNSCLKDLCCNLLTGCLSNASCLQLALCASGCTTSP